MTRRKKRRGRRGSPAPAEQRRAARCPPRPFALHLRGARRGHETAEASRRTRFRLARASRHRVRRAGGGRAGGVRGAAQGDPGRRQVTRSGGVPLVAAVVLPRWAPCRAAQRVHGAGPAPVQLVRERGAGHVLGQRLARRQGPAACRRARRRRVRSGPRRADAAPPGPACRGSTSTAWSRPRMTATTRASSQRCGSTWRTSATQSAPSYSPSSAPATGRQRAWVGQQVVAHGRVQRDLRRHPRRGLGGQPPGGRRRAAAPRRGPGVRRSVTTGPASTRRSPSRDRSPGRPAR